MSGTEALACFSALFWGGALGFSGLGFRGFGVLVLFPEGSKDSYCKAFGPKYHTIEGFGAILSLTHMHPKVLVQVVCLPECLGFGGVESVWGPVWVQP